MKFKMIALGILMATLSFGAAWEQSASVQNVKAQIRSENALNVGSNTLMLNLSQQNKPIENATVAVKVFMPAMPGMPAMESTSNAVAQGKGVYKTDADLDMHGTWQVHIFVTTKEGKKYRLKTSLNL